jgi:4-diphosphocytidyl-2-C-methyl-D-erythritol kinase
LAADAAATLRQLVDLWRLAMPEEELFDLAASLGADVPMCLAGRTAFASGIGEKLLPAPPLPDCAILLANPGTALATRDVFAARTASFSTPRPVTAWRDLDGLVAALAERGNDLTDAAISLAPAVGRLLETLRRSSGVRLASMSGSGATCFALYATTEDAQRAASSLPVAWWWHVGRFVSR